MNARAIHRVRLADGSKRVAIGPPGAPTDLLGPEASIDGLLGAGAAAVRGVGDLAAEPLVGAFDLLVPIGSQPVWASGVTYLRSREAREEESDTPDHYERVYDAERPELFLKALPGNAVGPGEAVGVRADSGWDVPEPELCIVVDPTGTICALTIGNDVSSRSIEGENPLYLPQAKSYRRSCAIGPALVPVDDDWAYEHLRIELDVVRDSRSIFRDAISMSEMKRSPHELAPWLVRCQDMPMGAVLLTGTGIVPPPSFTLTAGDEVDIAITGLGHLWNPVVEVA
ncbi:MAG: fumarylacetoacetate hydrolase family protein [Acidimicrobiia bacterium]|nr:fumarylacetoacetate hydrolase family protein [Acidimicrobiia bacterium]